PRGARPLDRRALARPPGGPAGGRQPGAPGGAAPALVAAPRLRGDEPGRRGGRGRSDPQGGRALHARRQARPGDRRAAVLAGGDALLGGPGGRGAQALPRGLRAGGAVDTAGPAAAGGGVAAGGSEEDRADFERGAPLPDPPPQSGRGRPLPSRSLKGFLTISAVVPLSRFAG